MLLEAKLLYIFYISVSLFKSVMGKLEFIGCYLSLSSDYFCEDMLNLSIFSIFFVCWSISQAYMYVKVVCSLNISISHFLYDHCSITHFIRLSIHDFLVSFLSSSFLTFCFPYLTITNSFASYGCYNPCFIFYLPHF